MVLHCWILVGWRNVHPGRPFSAWKTLTAISLMTMGSIHAQHIMAPPSYKRCYSMELAVRRHPSQNLKFCESLWCPGAASVSSWNKWRLKMIPFHLRIQVHWKWPYHKGETVILGEPNFANFMTKSEGYFVGISLEASLARSSSYETWQLEADQKNSNIFK